MKNRIMQVILCLFIVFSFACKQSGENNAGEETHNKPHIEEKEKENKVNEEEFPITFLVYPEEEGKVSAICEGKEIKSGVDKVKKGSEVIFTLKIRNPQAYEVDVWLGANQNDKTPLVARVTASYGARITAKLKKKGEDSTLSLKSLSIYEKDVDISDLNNIKIEVAHSRSELKSTDVKAMFIYGNAMNAPIEIDVNLDKKNLQEGKNEVEMQVVAVQGKYKGWKQKLLIVRKAEVRTTLDSLIIHNKKVDITDLENMRVEVDSIVDSIDAQDIIATFMYKENQEVPETLPFEIDKAVLSEGENIVSIEVEAEEGSYKGWKKKVTVYRKRVVSGTPISSNVKVSEIKTFIVDEQRKYGEPVLIENFDSKNSGPYRMQDAKTAYCAVILKIEKPANGDYEVYFENKNTYAPLYKAKRMMGEKSSYFKSSGIVLSKGFNIIEITVKTPDKKDVGVYKIVTKYSGAPDQRNIEVKDRQMLPGYYCPANRRPLDGELNDYVWAIGIAGYCIYCPEPLHRAGKGENLAEKYKGKGLRVIAIDTNGTAPYGSLLKWRDAGANYPLYDRVWNDFVPFYKEWPGYPRSLAIKEGKAVRMFNANEAEIKEEFGL